ncbi:hypothetical protein VB715_16785 [Crocosphaera sp. UHCC 0190]|nr:hypothetical protein [Crocosphaera sp. UHCC 0190]MEA5511431.1 hypothetical protein [Crocosphaera sp. UHCC 0190]
MLFEVVQVEVESLWQMFTPKGVGMKHQPIRLQHPRSRLES